MSGFKPLLTGLVLLGLFSAALFLFATQYISVNNPSSPLLTDSSFNNTINNMTAQLTGLKNKGDVAYNTTTQDSPNSDKPGLVFLIFNSVWTVPQQLIVTGRGMYDLFATFVFDSLFGQGARNQYYLIFNVIGFLLTITVVIVLWKIAKTGEGER